MIVAEVIDILKNLPQDYEVVFESGDCYGRAYWAHLNDIIVDDAYKEVKLRD